MQNELKETPTYASKFRARALFKSLAIPCGRIRRRHKVRRRKESRRSSFNARLANRSERFGYASHREPHGYVPQNHARPISAASKNSPAISQLARDRA